MKLETKKKLIELHSKSDLLLLDSPELTRHFISANRHFTFCHELIGLLSEFCRTTPAISRLTLRILSS
jgi:hypothetical protein